VGRIYKYKCCVKNCWKAAKPDCGYKEFALHMIQDHGKLEEVLEADPRPALQLVLGQIRAAREQQQEADRPRSCLVPGCPEADRQHRQQGGYRGLRQHYALAHWRRWFERSPGGGQARTQRLTKTGAHCQVCNIKLFGDDAKMIEHYAVVHDR
jgi:hypothetical protein